MNRHTGKNFVLDDSNQNHALECVGHYKSVLNFYTSPSCFVDTGVFNANQSILWNV